MDHRGSYTTGTRTHVFEYARMYLRIILNRGPSFTKELIN